MDQIAANRIVLSRRAGVWVARYHGPHADPVKAAFGTDTVPTAFIACAMAGDVYNTLQAAYPEVSIGIESSAFSPATQLHCGDVVWMKLPHHKAA